MRIMEKWYEKSACIKIPIKQLDMRDKKTVSFYDYKFLFYGLCSHKRAGRKDAEPMNL